MRWVSPNLAPDTRSSDSREGLNREESANGVVHHACLSDILSARMPAGESPPPGASLEQQDHMSMTIPRPGNMPDDAIPISRADLQPHQLHGVAVRRRYEEVAQWSSNRDGVKRSSRLVHPERPLIALLMVIACATILCLWMALRSRQASMSQIDALNMIRTSKQEP